MKLCSKCGKSMPDDSIYCVNCGVSTTLPNQAPEPAYQQTAPQPPTQTPPYTPSASQQPAQTPPYTPYNPYIQAPPSYPGMPSNQNQTVSVGDWVLTFFVSAIPVVGFIMLLVWAFGNDAKPSKKNYAKAALLLCLIGVVLSVLAIVFFATAFTALYDM